MTDGSGGAQAENGMKPSSVANLIHVMRAQNSGLCRPRPKTEGLDGR